MFTIDYKKLVTNWPIGEGRLTQVFPYQKAFGDNRWAVKYIPVQNFLKLIAIVQEVVVSFSHNHSALLQSKGFHAEQDRPNGYKVYVKMPRMKENMAQMIIQHKTTNIRFSQAQILEHFHTLITGLDYLHSRHIAHKNIKLTNIFLDYQDKLKLADVSLTSLIEDQEQYRLLGGLSGPENHLAPEMLSEDYRPKKGDFYSADLWSLGLVMLEMCLLNTKLIKSQMTVEERRKAIQDGLEEAKLTYSDKIVVLLSRMLQFEPEVRGMTEDTRKALEEILNTKKGGLYNF